MKIDCPHCGVHGSVDDSLAGKKLRCPKCSKVFLIPEELLPESDDAGLMRQEILQNDEPQGPVAGEEESSELQENVDTNEVAEEEEDTGTGDLADDDEQQYQVCSDCGQSLAPEFLEEVDSRLYCTLCKPEPEETADALQEEGEAAEATTEDGLIEEESLVAESLGEEEALAEEESLAPEGPGEEEPLAGEKVLVAEDLAEDDSLAGEYPELETCSGCGESLHPEFLEHVGSKRYCALCLPEDVETDEGVSEVEATDGASSQDAEVPEAEPYSPATPPADEAVSDAEESLQEVCSVCGERFHPDFLQEVDSKLYCGVCQPEVIEVLTGAEDKSPGATAEVMAAAATDVGGDGQEQEPVQSDNPDFSIGDVLKEAWQKTKGAKGAIWGGLAVMYLILFALGFGASFGLQRVVLDLDPNMAIGINAGVQMVATCFSAIFTAGIMLIGVKRATEQRVSWKMVFAGFSKALSVIIALILQTLLVFIGFCLLVLPGIYLSVGYALTLPLILEKGLGPWQALEASRKAIHKKWWTVFGVYLLMGLIYLVSAIPLGLGLIWSVPMFFVGLGVLYRLFFGSSVFEEEEYAEDEQEAAPEENQEEQV